jgi:hypothetical protein
MPPPVIPELPIPVGLSRPDVVVKLAPAVTPVTVTPNGPTHIFRDVLKENPRALSSASNCCWVMGGLSNGPGMLTSIGLTIAASKRCVQI